MVSKLKGTSDASATLVTVGLIPKTRNFSHFKILNINYSATFA